MNNIDYRIYSRDKVIVFKKTKEDYGGLSNMASGYPIVVENVSFLTSEALYQAMRFPDFPEIQKQIIEQKSPMTAKMISKKYKNKTRDDWDEVRIMVMRWCIRVKLIHNWDKFGCLLLSTRNNIIVEESHKDLFWGAVPDENNLLIGTNALGRLIMELREELPSYIRADELGVPDIKKFELFGAPIKSIKFRIEKMPKFRSPDELKLYKNLSLFDDEH
ncbi:NADAR family protein [Exiguobacterium sp. s196]|uniref:NADAR family protein n=1 Tax=Exiguobacterium sp. s196 TaxID=2751283 RepID=UPI00203569ED|nr:NADAR family protein [Exiguobacterium sp. s196]